MVLAPRPRAKRGGKEVRGQCFAPFIKASIFCTGVDYIDAMHLVSVATAAG